MLFTLTILIIEENYFIEVFCISIVFILMSSKYIVILCSYLLINLKVCIKFATTSNDLKVFVKLNTHKTNNPVKWAEATNRHFPHKTYR